MADKFLGKIREGLNEPRSVFELEDGTILVTYGEGYTKDHFKNIKEFNKWEKDMLENSIDYRPL